MKLTAQIWDEMEAINVRVEALHTQAYTNYPDCFEQVRGVHSQELTSYKVRVEIFFSSTDVKEQSDTRLRKKIFKLFYANQNF